MSSANPLSASDAVLVRTKSEFAELLRQRVAGRLFVNVSNREPFVHSFGPHGQVSAKAAVGGLTLALNSVMQATGGVWVAHGSGDADRASADATGKLRVPPDNPAYDLQRVWLTSEENDGYYNGCANQAIWPICHLAFTKPVFRNAHWEAYRRVNVKFADAVARVVGDRDAIIFIQDYHFALLPALIKQRCPTAVCVQFWHIPWPVPEVLAMCPWHGQILDGVLGNDVFGVHTPEYAERFLRAAKGLAGRKVAGSQVLLRNGRPVRVQAFPISIDFDSVSERASSAECDAAVNRLRDRYDLGGKFVVLGLDRIDYTKGVLERLQAIERMLEKHPGMRPKMAYVHAGAPSRTDIPAYRDLHEAVDAIEARINAGSSNPDHGPIISLKRQLADSDVLALYRLADVCVVSSLEDGMNLVAKEFLAARNDEGGHLLLSEFTGAAWELPGADCFNPLARDDFAERLYALSGPDSADGGQRMRRLREHVRAHNIYGWIGSVLQAVPERRDRA
jgi:trehalose 6-phosphate synthase